MANDARHKCPSCGTPVSATRVELIRIRDALRSLKERAVKEQDFPVAAAARDGAAVIQAQIESPNPYAAPPVAVPDNDPWKATAGG